MRTTLLAWVEDRPGVLARVAGMFRRRGFNIESLAVGQSERSGQSRMTIVVDSGRMSSHIVEENLRKLVEVVDVHDVSAAACVQRELCLAKVRSESATRIEIAQLAGIFRGKIVDVGLDTLIVECSGDREKIDGLLRVLAPYGLLEVMRTGTVAMVRGQDPSLEEFADNE